MADEAAAAGLNQDAERNCVWATDKVILTDARAYPDDPMLDFTCSNMATANLIVFFMPGCADTPWYSQYMCEMLLWAWRLRQTTQTIFVLPELDVLLAPRSRQAFLP